MKFAKIVDIRRGGFLWFGGWNERYIEIEAYNELALENHKLSITRNFPDRCIQQAIQDVQEAGFKSREEGLMGLYSLQRETVEWLRGLKK